MPQVTLEKQELVVEIAKTEEVKHLVSDRYLSLSGDAGRVLQAISYWPTLGLLKFFLHFKVDGQENIKHLNHKEVIFASNHTSFVDGPMAAAAMPRFYNKVWPQGFMPIRFTALQEFFRWFNPLPFPIGMLAASYVRLNGSIPVQRASGDLEKALHNVVRVIKDHTNTDKVWIFPEGGISRDGHVHQGKRGIAHLYKKTGVPIVPVAITGTYNLGVVGFFLRRRHAVLKIGKPIVSFREDASLEEIVDEIMKEIAKLANKQYMDNIYEGHRRELFKEGRLGKFAYSAIVKIFSPLVKLLWVEKIEGLENFPKDKRGLILASNHESYFDFINAIASSPRKIHYMATEKFFHSWFWLPLMKMTGQIRVDRRSADKNKMFEHVYSALRQGHVLGIFPEGTRNREDNECLQKAYTGVARIALNAKVDVLPLGVIGTYKIMSPYDKFPRLDKKATLKFGKPISLAEYYDKEMTDELLREATDKIMAEISTLCGKRYQQQN